MKDEIMIYREKLVKGKIICISNYMREILIDKSFNEENESVCT